MNNKQEISSPTNHRVVAKLFTAIFLPLSIIVGAIVMIIYYTEVRNNRIAIETKEVHIVGHQKEMIINKLNSVLSDLIFLAENYEIEVMLKKSEITGTEYLAIEYLIFSQRREKIYDRMSFLDETGKEIVKIKFNEGTPFIVPDEQLQSKADRYYFKETFKLGHREIYVSPFALNSERGETGQPLKPIIRFGTPVFDSSNQKRGIVILSYLAANLHNHRPGPVMLLDSSRFCWIHCQIPIHAADGLGKELSPETWQQISGVVSGQFQNADGLFTFSTIYPLLDTHILKDSFELNKDQIEKAKANHWKIVSHVSPALLSTSSWDLLSNLLLMYSVLVIVIAVGSWFLSSSIVKRRSAEKGLYNLIERLNGLVKELRIDVQLAKRFLTSVNGSLPRYIDLSYGPILFFDTISLPCHQEGGDHYFVRKLPGNNRNEKGRTVISLKDQSGHLVACILRSVITDLLHQSLLDDNNSMALEHILGNLNTKIRSLKFFPEDEYFTSIDGEIDHKTLKMRFVSGGHPPFILIRGNQVHALPDIGGAGHNTPMVILDKETFSVGEVQLQYGDKMLFYTDGLTDASAQNGKEAISTGELIEMVGKYAALPISEIMTRIVTEVAGLSGETINPLKNKNSSQDDVTLMGVEIEDRNEFLEEVWQPKNREDFDHLYEDLYQRLLKEWKLRGFEREYRLHYVSYECIINAYLHGNKEDPNKSIHIRWRWGNDFYLEVIDQGDGFDYAKVSDPTSNKNLLKEYGRGIFVIRQFASYAKWENSGRHLKTCFKKHPGITEEENIQEAEKYLRLWKKKIWGG